jgi:hypothetical protein
MPTPVSLFSGDEDGGVNFRLWLGILLPPFSGGINTLVGYVVSTYDCSVRNRHLALLVNIFSALLCVIAGITSYSTKQKIKSPADDWSESLLHARRFMMCLGFAFTVGFLLFVAAGTISTFLLHPCDL